MIQTRLTAVGKKVRLEAIEGKKAETRKVENVKKRTCERKARDP